MASTAEKDDKDHQLNGELYNALLSEDAEMKVMELCARLDEHAFHILTIHNDTVLHKATYAKQANLVLSLLDRRLASPPSQQNDRPKRSRQHYPSRGSYSRPRKLSLCSNEDVRESPGVVDQDQQTWRNCTLSGSPLWQD
jgi:hypothetical protein